MFSNPTISSNIKLTLATLTIILADRGPIEALARADDSGCTQKRSLQTFSTPDTNRDIAPRITASPNFKKNTFAFEVSEKTRLDLIQEGLIEAKKLDLFLESQPDTDTILFNLTEQLDQVKKDFLFLKSAVEADKIPADSLAEASNIKDPIARRSSLDGLLISLIKDNPNLFTNNFGDLETLYGSYEIKDKAIKIAILPAPDSQKQILIFIDDNLLGTERSTFLRIENNGRIYPKVVQDKAESPLPPMTVDEILSIIRPGCK